mgnify:CR=1 FL=1
MAESFIARLLGRASPHRKHVQSALLHANDPNAEMRRSAAFRLGKHADKSDEEVAEVLNKLKDDPVREVRNAAKWAMQRLETGSN